MFLQVYFLKVLSVSVSSFFSMPYGDTILHLYVKLLEKYALGYFFQQTMSNMQFTEATEKI